MTLPPSQPSANAPRGVVALAIGDALVAGKTPFHAADAVLSALARAGYVVIPRILAERATSYVPNGYGESSLPLHNQLRAWLSDDYAQDPEMQAAIERERLNPPDEDGQMSAS